MKCGKRELGTLLMLLCTGCFVQSITPFYTASSIIAMPQIPGTWQLLKENSNRPLKTLVNAWIIRATVADSRDAPSSFYEVTAFDSNNREGKLNVVFFAIGGETYCDVTAIKVPEPNRYWDVNMCPLHTLCKVELNDDVLVLRMLSRDWMEKAVTAKEVTMNLFHRVQFGPVLLIATSEEWKAFLEKFGKTEGVFSKERLFELKRIKEDPPVEGRPVEGK
jgi:hypothetical protein